MNKTILMIVASTGVLALSGCGGGSSSPDTTPIPIIIPSPATASAPTLVLSISSEKAPVGTAVTVSWSSTNATSCSGLDGLTGNKVTVGSEVITPTSGGQYKYTLSCIGAGGNATKSVSLAVPIPVYPTSFQNAKLIDQPSKVLPVTMDGVYPNVRLWSARAYADFEQNGTLSYFTTTLNYTDKKREGFGTLYFFRQNSDGSFSDISDAMIEGTRVGCKHARKALVADFNQDTKPDVFVACHGLDVLPLTYTEKGEMPILLLSQPNGKYKASIVDVGITAYMHGASAADLNGDGYPDIAVADQKANDRNESSVYFLINNKDGTFTKDTSNFAGWSRLAVWSIELLDWNQDGQLDLWAAGTEGVYSGALQSSFIPLVGSMKFDESKRVNLPESYSWNMPTDIILNGNLVYIVRTSASFGTAIQRINMTDKSASIIYTSTVEVHLPPVKPDCEGVGGSWVDWMRVFKGQIITDDKCRSPNIPAN